HCDSNGVYITSYNGNTLEVSLATDNGITTHTLQLQGEVKSVATYNGTIYAISATDNTLLLNSYAYNKCTLNTFILEADSINSKYKFTVTDNKIYFAENNDYSQLACHSTTGEKLYSFYMRTATDYQTDSNGTLYICTPYELYTSDTTCNSQPQCILSNTNIRGNISVCDNAVFDYAGNIINLQNGLTIPTNIISHHINSAVINGYYCKYSSGNIYGYTEDGSCYTLYNINAGENAQLCGFNNSLYVLSDNKELFIINESELDFPQKSTQPQNSYSSNLPHLAAPHNSSPHSENNHDKQDYSFSVNNYYIDKTSNIIWNIPCNTTISSFKNNLTCTGYTLEFYNAENVKKTSGKIGTGFTMLVKDNTTEHSRYTLSVKGDLSGDGNINRADVTLLSDYLMSSATLTNEQYASADTNADNIINGVDILKIARNNL
ncbi:MAG: dockerin type I repeat-containing protein, partial [Acutalibacteraceae bacterium]|nr:dockerin type I repeat-containing protein [Acutalibacteraceae bacterium]